jgi:hypothetical protein
VLDRVRDQVAGRPREPRTVAEHNRTCSAPAEPQLDSARLGDRAPRLDRVGQQLPHVDFAECVRDPAGLEIV